MDGTVSTTLPTCTGEKSEPTLKNPISIEGMSDAYNRGIYHYYEGIVGLNESNFLKAQYIEYTIKKYIAPNPPISAKYEYTAKYFEAIEGKREAKGTYISNVSSEARSTYPNDGKLGTNWYVYAGIF